MNYQSHEPSHVELYQIITKALKNNWGKKTKAMISTHLIDEENAVSSSNSIYLAEALLRIGSKMKPDCIWEIEIDPIARLR